MAQELTDTEQGCKPCPYCGAKGEQLSLYSCGYHHIECMICFANGPRGSSPQIAVEGWNSRRLVESKDCPVCGGTYDEYLGFTMHENTCATIKKRLARDRFAHDDAAKALYETWRNQPGWVPWVERGNSLMQMKARREAVQ